MGRADDGMKCMEVRSLLKKGDYEGALEVADTIDIDKVKSIVDLKILASAYERAGQYENAKYVLMKSYEQKHSKMTIYRLAYLSIKTGEFDDAEALYQEFSELAPNSPDRYILRYGIDRAKNVDYVLRIATLQKLKQIEYTEEWGYELAKIYHKAGLHEDCIRECQDLIIWFGSGIIVDKAKLLCKYHEEGKAALEAYGVLDENLSSEELEERREQFFDDTADLNQQQESVEEARLRKLVERDFEKTVNLHQILKEEGEDIDLLKKEVHRVWGQTSAEMISQSRQQEWDAQQGEMEPIMDRPLYTGDTEQMLANSMAQLMEEEAMQTQGEFAYSEEELQGQNVDYAYPDMQEILPGENAFYGQEADLQELQDTDRYHQQFDSQELYDTAMYGQEPYFSEEYQQGEYPQEQQLEESVSEAYLSESYDPEHYVSEEYHNIEEGTEECLQEMYEPRENEQESYSVEDFSEEIEQEEVPKEPEEEKVTGARAFLSKRQARRAARREKRRKAREEKKKLQEQENDGYVTERLDKEEGTSGIEDQTVRVSLKPGSENAEAAILARIRNKISGDNSTKEETKETVVQSSNELIIDEGLDDVEDWMFEEQEAVSEEESLQEEIQEAHADEPLSEVSDVQVEEEISNESPVEEPLEESSTNLQEEMEQQEEVLMEQAPMEENIPAILQKEMELKEEPESADRTMEEELSDETSTIQTEEVGSEEAEQSEDIEKTGAEATEEVEEEEEENQFRNTYGAMLWEYFEKYQQDTRLCEDAYSALEGAMAKKDPVNYVLTCKNKERASEFTKEFAKALHRLGLSEKPQVAVTTAEKLNFMHLDQKYEKLQGGILLVQDAKKMTPDTVQSIMNMCDTLQGKITVILTDARPYLMDLLDEYPMMKRFFPYDISMR